MSGVFPPEWIAWEIYHWEVIRAPEGAVLASPTRPNPFFRMPDDLNLTRSATIGLQEDVMDDTTWVYSGCSIRVVWRRSRQRYVEISSELASHWRHRTRTRAWCITVWSRLSCNVPTEASLSLAYNVDLWCKISLAVSKRRGSHCPSVTLGRSNPQKLMVVLWFDMRPFIDKVGSVLSFLDVRGQGLFSSRSIGWQIWIFRIWTRHFWSC